MDNNEFESEVKILDEKEMINLMFGEACFFLEVYYGNQWEYFSKHGYSGPPPRQFKPSMGDKIILRNLIEKRMDCIPEGIRIRFNVGELARRILFEDYYPRYDWFNQTQNLDLMGHPNFDLK